MFQDPGDLAMATSTIVAALAIVMGWLSLRSYHATGNVRILFVAVAFAVFILKALFVVTNELADPHFVDHHVALYISGLFDVVIVLLLFVPFVARGR
ncbi:MAG: hypothetical protein KY455_07325 [Euryarchaeota archaeon]|nr:hypothetical protein [Euryarchaeota archaeon]